MLHDMIIPRTAAGERLDRWLESELAGCTRSLISRLIKQGHCVLIDAKGGVQPAKAGYAIKGGEQVSLEVPEIEPMEAVAEDIPIEVLHEDEHIIVINKPADMVVHPAIGHLRGTLVNAVLGRYGHTLPSPDGDGQVVWRPGIVHRLDEDTSGLILIARTPAALTFLQDAFKARDVHKRYLALVAGKPRADFMTCDGAIGRHPKDFRKRAVVPADRPDAKEAHTAFVVIERHDGYAAVECRPHTGRTHQIRVHLAHLGHPVLADRMYGRADRWPLNATDDDPKALHRQALHAWAIDIPHPAGGRKRFLAPIPADMARYVKPGLAPRG
jgi:23S rRNA pseudouridine1911/1915/1917 synthase